MEGISLKALAEVLGQRTGYDRLISHISTDSRDITEGCLFVCIEGERFDGHDFAAAAIAGGAAMVVARKPVPVSDERVLYVENTMNANIKLAGAYRRMFSPLAVGLTGSVGKTTTKEFIAGVLSKRYKTLKTEGNQNNEIGVPRTLLNLTAEYEAMVVEMGMNGVGDIDKLTRSVLPDIGVITNIGTSHIELLGSRENILKTKLEIVNGLKKGSPLILCDDNDLLSGVTIEDMRVVLYGIASKRADYRALDIRETGFETEFTIEFLGQRERILIPTIGRHNVLNALAAFAVGIEAKIEVSDIIEGLGGYTPSGSRQKIVDCGVCRVVEDCYNASPDSVRAAILTLAGMGCKGKRIMALGDMLELGETSEQAHKEMGRCCAEQNIDCLLAYGERARWYVEGAISAGIGMALHFEDKRLLAEKALSLLGGGDIVWFKASRGMKLEEGIEIFYNGLK